jgi:HK97 family phage major capsid protein
MSRLKALGEKRAKIQEELDGIRASCEKENRSRNEAEKTKWASLEKERDELDEEIKIEEREVARAEAEVRNKKPVTNPNKQDGDKIEETEEKVPSVRAQIMDWQKRNKESIEKLKAGQKADLTPLEIRAAASPMTPTNTLTNTITVNAGVVPQFESGIHDIRRVKPTFWDYLPKGRTGSASYTWVNKKKDADTGAAAFIGPGVAKPGISFKLEREVSNAKKIAVSDKLAIELLDDVEGMESYVKNEMVYQLRAKANTTLMSGTESSTVPGGIQGESVTYSLTGIETQDPNNFDCIRAVVAQLAVGHFGGLPVTVFINPVDAANMDLAKSGAQGVYLLPPFSTSDGRQIAGATIVEDNNVTAGYFQAACLDLFKCLIYKDMTIALGWENDDFTKNLVTYICEMRLHVFHSENDAGAFIYDTFANVKALIDAEAA